VSAWRTADASASGEVAGKKVGPEIGVTEKLVQESPDLSVQGAQPPEPYNSLTGKGKGTALDSDGTLTVLGEEETAVVGYVPVTVGWEVKVDLPTLAAASAAEVITGIWVIVLGLLWTVLVDPREVVRFPRALFGSPC